MITIKRFTRVQLFTPKNRRSHNHQRCKGGLILKDHAEEGKSRQRMLQVETGKADVISQGGCRCPAPVILNSLISLVLYPEYPYLHKDIILMFILWEDRCTLLKACWFQTYLLVTLALKKYSGFTYLKATVRSLLKNFPSRSYFWVVFCEEYLIVRSRLNPNFSLFLPDSLFSLSYFKRELKAEVLLFSIVCKYLSCVPKNSSELGQFSVLT